MSVLISWLDSSPKIISNWRDWPKMWSVRFAGIGAFLQILVAAFVQALAATSLILVTSLQITLIVGAILFIVSAISKLFTQKNISPNDTYGK